jgi:HlyD family secretion protein
LRRIAPLLVLVAIVAAGSAAYASNSGSGPSYVTGVVTRGDVQQSLNLTGSVQQVNQVSAAFPVSGTVTSVSVGVGQQVSAGQQLATIDATPLQSALLEAQATLAQAQASLQSDEDGTSTATTSAAITGPIATATLTAFTPTGSGHGSSDVNSLEKAVTAAQAQAASSQAAVNTALLAAITDCATSPTPTPTPSGSPTPTPSGSATPTPSSSASAHTAAYTTPGMSCADALAGVQRAEMAEAAATKQLADAVSKLAAAAAAASQSSGNTGSSGSGGSGTARSTGSGSSSGSSSGSTRSGGSFSGGQNAAGSGSSTNSASRIASDQADVVTAQVAVTDAQRNLDAAIRPPAPWHPSGSPRASRRARAARSPSSVRVRPGSPSTCRWPRCRR